MSCVMYTDSGKKRELHFKHILTGKITRNRPSRDVLKSMQRRIEKEKRRVERTKNMDLDQDMMKDAKTYVDRRLKNWRRGKKIASNACDATSHCTERCGYVLGG